MRPLVESAYSVISDAMVAAIPRPVASDGCRKQRRATAAWSEAVASLRAWRTCVRSGSLHDEAASSLWLRASEAWQRAMRLTEELLTQSRDSRYRTAQAPTMVSAALFARDQVTWARSIGFGAAAAAVAAATSTRAATQSATEQPGDTTRHDLLGALPESLDDSARRTDSAQPSVLDGWIDQALRVKGDVFRISGRAWRDRRADALRNHDIGEWARLLRRASGPSAGHAVEWYHRPDGSRVRPRDAEEARTGIAQEWSRLLVEPADSWQHPLIKQWRDSAGRPRGSLDLQQACIVPPN